MNLRLAAAAVALVLTACAATGCSSPPIAPEPTPAFSSEAEAFAAAEATYRAYVDALNQVDLSDPSTFEDVYAWTTGELNAQDRKNFSSWHASGYAISGVAQIESLRQIGAVLGSDLEVTIDACYNVADVDVRDKDGKSLVADSRPDVQALQVAATPSDTTTTGLAISSIGPSEGAEAC